MTNLLEVSEIQKKNVEMLTRGNDQYFRTVTRMVRGLDYLETGETADAEKTLASAATALKNTADALEQFNSSDHSIVDSGTAEAMSTHWSALITQGLQPMLAAARDNRPEAFRQLMRKTYPPLSIAFGAAMEKYQTGITERSNRSLQQVYDLVSWSKNGLLAAMAAGLFLLLLTDRYLVD